MLYLKSAQRPRNPRVRALFVENMSGPVLQMLGTMCAQFPSIQMFEFTGAYVSYNIEPFFFSSSLSWIPSRFQEEVQPGRGDR